MIRYLVFADQVIESVNDIELIAANKFLTVSHRLEMNVRWLATAEAVLTDAAYTLKEFPADRMIPFHRHGGSKHVFIIRLSPSYLLCFKNSFNSFRWINTQVSFIILIDIF